MMMNIITIIGTARIVCGAGTMQLSDVRVSVCLSHSPAARRCCGFVAVGPARRRYRSIAVWLSAVAAPQQGAQQQMRAVPRYQLT